MYTHLSVLLTTYTRTCRGEKLYSCNVCLITRAISLYISEHPGNKSHMSNVCDKHKRISMYTPEPDYGGL